MGLRVAITSSSDDKLARMRAMGADITVNYRTSPNWERDVLAATGGEGVHIALNNVGHTEVPRCLASCTSGATMILIGGKRIEPGVETIKPSVPRNLTITAISSGTTRMLEDFAVAVEFLKLKPVVDKVFSFEDAPAAYAWMQSNDRIGKIVIKVA
jgi:NADPH:quinone reductase-like Zn-dependent oxidoreductase